jgi:ABC-2 type transport system ATP-binding protein
MSEPLLQATHVRVEFGTLVAVRDLTVELRGGDLLGLVGPNGAGKTTSLRAMAGLQPLTAGLIRVLGHDVVEAGTFAMPNIGFASDTPPLYEKLTVEDFLTFIGLAYGLDRAEIDDRIGFWLDRLWLSERRKDKIKSLSRGMRQRLAVARTLLPGPQVILLDEPAAGLDPAGRVAFRRLLCNLRDQGKAIIVSSHILSDLHEYCTHIGIMSHGEVIRLGTVREVVNGEQNHRCRYRLTLAKTLPDAAARLAEFEGIADVRVDREEIVFEAVDDREHAAALLRRMIAEGVPVAAFGAIPPGLEEAYLRSGVKQVD